MSAYVIVCKCWMAVGETVDGYVCDTPDTARMHWKENAREVEGWRRGATPVSDGAFLLAGQTRDALVHAEWEHLNLEDGPTAMDYGDGEPAWVFSLPWDWGEKD